MADEVVEDATGTKKLSVFEKYLTLWVFLCIIGGIILGRLLPDISSVLDSMSLEQVSIPIAICLFFMMYPIMVKIDFAEVIRAGKTPKPVLLTLFANWVIKPFTMVGIATLFLAFVFKGWIPGIDEGIRYASQVPLYRSYISNFLNRMCSTSKR